MSVAGAPGDRLGYAEFPDVPALVEVFNHHGVRYVLIGGYVAQAFVADLCDRDVDFTPSRPKDREVLPQL